MYINQFINNYFNINIMEDLEKLMDKAIKDLEKLRLYLDVCDGKKCEWVYSGKDYKKCSICGDEEY